MRAFQATKGQAVQEPAQAEDSQSFSQLARAPYRWRCGGWGNRARPAGLVGQVRISFLRCGAPQCGAREARGAVTCPQKDYARSGAETVLARGKMVVGGQPPHLCTSHGRAVMVASRWAVKEDGETWTELRAMQVQCSQGLGTDGEGREQG